MALIEIVCRRCDLAGSFRVASHQLWAYLRITSNVDLGRCITSEQSREYRSCTNHLAIQTLTVRYHSNNEDQSARAVIRSLLAISIVSIVGVGSLITVAWMLFLVSGFGWLGGTWIKWLVSFF
jgi:hypothetical protein